MMCTAMNILFSTSTLASKAEYEPAFIAVRPFHRRASRPHRPDDAVGYIAHRCANLMRGSST